MLPPEFIERINRQPYIDAGSLVTALNTTVVTSVRVNLRKWPHDVAGYERVEWEADGYYLPDRPLFTADPLFHAGAYYPQESSSMFAGEMFRQLTEGRSGLRVLDLCGAPGGKSTHLATLAGDNGLLVANEVIRTRAAVLAENITKWGTGNVIVTNADPSRFGSLPDFFDVIVADAPCSGEGMFRSPAVVSEWSVDGARLCSERQRRIISEAWPSLRPGGILIYSTCTFNPAENEGNVAWLRDTAGATPETVTLPPGCRVTPVQYNGVEGYGFYPGRVKGEGFFIAALRKPVLPGSIREDKTGILPGAGGKNYRKGSLRPSPEAFRRVEHLVDFEPDRVVADDGRITALATEAGLYSYISERLPVIKSGTMIGEIKKNELVQAHDLAMSVRMKAGALTRHPLTREEAVAFLRLEGLKGSSMPAGRVLLTYRGVPLGFANNLGTRVNNGYPRSWRIRMEMTGDFDEILK